AAMLVVYLAMLTMIGHRLFKTGRESLRLRFQNLDLLRDLTHSKERQESAQDALQQAYGELEIRVRERTAELARSEEALRNADKRKDEFLAMLGHELRNPLAPIRGAVHIMKRDAPQNPQVK